ncbi:MAG: hypothetical protein ACO1SV_14195 [Fimbriimonas sp.]
MLNGALSRAARRLAVTQGPLIPHPFREFHSFRGFVLPPQWRPKTRQEAVDAAVRQFRAAQAAGMFRPAPGVLHVITGTEFGFNGHETDKGEIEYSAKEPMSAEFYPEMVATIQELIRKEGAGVLYCPGTIALDTGRLKEGKKVGENRAFVVSSGADSEVMEISKKYPSNIDGWDSDLFSYDGGPEAGYRTFSITDAFDGRRTHVGFSICFDYAKEIASGRIRFPIAPHLLVSPSAGWPGGPPPFDVQVLVADAIHNPFNGGFEWSTVWEARKRDPLLERAFRLAKEGFPLAATYLAGTYNFLMSSRKWREYLVSERVMSRRPYSLLTFGSERAIDTGTSKLSESLALDRIVAATQAALTDGATFVSEGIGQTEIDARAKEFERMARDLPWDYIHERSREAIREEVARQIREQSLNFEQGGKHVLDALDYTAIRDAVSRVVREEVTEALDAEPDFARIVEQIGKERADAMVESVFGGTLVRRMDLLTGGRSYITDSVDAEVYGQEFHYLSQNATRLEAEAATARQQVETTSGEVRAKDQSLEDVKRALEREPARTDLIEQRDRIARELDALREELRRREADRKDREERSETTGKERDRIERERREAESRREARTHDVFPRRI